MKTIARIVLFTTVAAALAACGGAAPTGFAPDQEVEAYAYVHGGYVGQAMITTDAEGAMDITINEAFLPHTIALVDMEEDKWTEDNTVFYTSHGNEKYAAKYIAYDGTAYTGVAFGNTIAYVESGDDGEPAGDTMLEKHIIRNEDNMAAWFSNIADGKFEVFTEFGGEAEAVTTTSYGSLFKRDSSYWNFGIGWKGNIEAIEEAAEENGVRYSLDDMTRRGDDRWALTDAVTSATASDFKDYYALIQQAAARLKME